VLYDDIESRSVEEEKGRGLFFFFLSFIFFIALLREIRCAIDQFFALSDFADRRISPMSDSPNLSSYVGLSMYDGDASENRFTEVAQDEFQVLLAHASVFTTTSSPGSYSGAEVPQDAVLESRAGTR